MSFIKIQSMQFNGLDPCPISVEAVKFRGAKSLSLSGFAHGWLKESKDKIIATVSQNSTWGPMNKILIHLLPVHQSKRSAHLELPIALACLVVLFEDELSEPSKKFLENNIYSAALSLDGSLVHTELNDLLNKMSFPDKKVIGAENFQNIQELWDFALNVTEDYELPKLKKPSLVNSYIHNEKNEELSVNGRYWERLALLVAATAKLPVLLIGAPGVGKSHMALWSSQVYREGNLDILKESELIWSLSENFNKDNTPVITPHAKSHLSEFIGTNRNEIDRPGYFALAHGGTLILDEFSEMNRDCRELLRNVLDQKMMKRNTKSAQLSWPADFWLVLTSNPCPCGMSSGQDISRCRCPEGKRMAYQNRLSGPVLDRMGIKLLVDAFDESTALSERYAFLDDSCEELSLKVLQARQLIPDFFPEADEKLVPRLKEEKMNPRSIKNKHQLYCAFRALTGEKHEEALKWILILHHSEKNLFPRD